MTDKPLHANEHCRHYKYVRAAVDWGPQCACGIDLQAPGANTEPCMPDPATTAPACAWREEFTADERAAWKAWRAESTGRMILIMSLIPGSSLDKKKKPFWGKSGEFDCPACKTGKVKWVRAPNNGHVQASCSTPNCFAVIE